MTEQPERIWAWHWYENWDENPPTSGPKAIAQYGHCRRNQRYALDERERKSGAEYIRADLVEKMKESYEKPTKYSWTIRWLRYVKTWRKHRAVIKELNAVDDKTLKDIGISRCDIDMLIWLEHDLEKRGKKKNDE
jgi:uncharacterized protein YjiS (DUF1127 family)